MANTKNRPFKVDGVAIPTPDSYKCGIEDLSSEATGRTLDGVMHKDVVAVKKTYECTWNYLSWEDAATLLTAVNGKASFSFTHADPMVPNRFVTGTFYAGKRSPAALNLNAKNGKAWKDISITFIEI